jgi:glycosyltransferase involved in cell wall biosynthesis
MSLTINIAIDGNEANVANRVGSNVYAFQILHAMEELTRFDAQLDFTVLLAEPPESDFPVERQGWHYQVVGPKPIWTQIALPIHLYFHSYDVLFSPGHYAPRLSKVPYVSSVMDLAFLYFPEQFRVKDVIQLRDWTKYSVKHAAKVVAISQATKNDVIKQYHRQPDDVVIAYPAIATRFDVPTVTATKTVLKKFSLAEPYFLYVGTLQPRKNLIRLIEAYERLIDQPNFARSKQITKGLPDLVIAGKVGWMADDLLARVAASPVTQRIKMLGYVTDDEKTVLYQQATALVLIGLYEGFGMPPLEAMQAGTLPVVSNSSSLPEVVGSAGILVDPENVDSIADGLRTVVSLSAKQRAQYRKEARLQLRLFDWQTSAQTILTTLLQVAKHDQT